MFKEMENRKLSDIALRWLIGAVIVAGVLALPHGFFEGWHYATRDGDRDLSVMIATTVGDTRFLAEQLMYVSALIFVGAKFFETRTTFAVTFDRVDVDKVRLRGPDDENIVWIGHRYGTRMEAETVAASLENRLKENAA
jgi:hypothetical protein